MSMADRLKKNSTIKETAYINESKVFGENVFSPTSVPMINVALSGDINGGLQSGMTMWAGPSKHFKTIFTLVCAKAYQDKYPDGVILWYDSEFGSPPAYFESAGIDLDRVVHTPVTNIEQLKNDIAVQLSDIKRGDHVCICIDSIGNLASKKEVDDALEGKIVADLTRARAMNSLFRVIGAQPKLKDIPLIVINHTYATMEIYSKQVVSGGTKIMYNSDNVYIIGRRQVKDGKDIEGYDFIIKVEKSRFVKEGSQIPISVRFEGGIEKWSGLLDVAELGGYVVKPNQGWFQRANPATGEVLEEGKHRRKATNTKEFWDMVFEKTDFAEFIKKSYKMSTGKLISDDEDSGDGIEEVSSKGVMEFGESRE